MFIPLTALPTLQVLASLLTSCHLRLWPSTPQIAALVGPAAQPQKGHSCCSSSYAFALRAPVGSIVRVRHGSAQDALSRRIHTHLVDCFVVADGALHLLHILFEAQGLHRDHLNEPKNPECASNKQALHLKLQQCAPDSWSF